MNIIAKWLQRHAHVNWAFADQLLVSGSGFITGVLLARALGLDGYGRFALLYAMLLYANTIQTATVIAPMMSQLPKLASGAARQRYVGGVLALQLALSLVSAMVIGVMVAVYHWVRSSTLPDGVPALAVMVFFFQLQDWLRRFLYANLRPVAVFINDAVSYGGQLVLLGGLAWLGQLTVSRALWAIAFTSALAMALGWLVERFKPDFGLLRKTFVRHYRLGRDMLISGQIQWAGSQGLLVLAGSVLGADTAGGIRAAQNILGPMNVVNNLVMNIVPVSAARHFQSAGAAGLVRYLKASGTILVSCAFVFCLLVSISSASLMIWVYGPAYLAYAPLVAWGAGYWFFSFISGQFSIYHRTAESSQHLIVASILFAAASVLITVGVIDYLREAALFFAAIVGQLVMIAYLWWAIKKSEEKT